MKKKICPVCDKDYSERRKYWKWIVFDFRQRKIWYWAYRHVEGYNIATWCHDK